MADGGPWLHRVCEGSAVVLDSPPPRQRSTQLEARLEKLREDLDNKNYKKVIEG